MFLQSNAQHQRRAAPRTFRCNRLLARPFAMSTLSEIALAAECLEIREGRFTSLAPSRGVIDVKFDARAGRRTRPARAAREPIALKNLKSKTKRWVAGCPAHTFRCR